MILCESPQIPSDPYTEMFSMAGCQQIVTMCMSPAEETLAISTDRGQMYHLSLTSIDMKKVLLYTAAQK